MGDKSKTRGTSNRISGSNNNLSTIGSSKINYNYNKKNNKDIRFFQGGPKTTSSKQQNNNYIDNRRSGDINTIANISNINNGNINKSYITNNYINNSSSNFNGNIKKTHFL